MITRLHFPTLFDDGNASLDHNGYGLLKDAISVEVTEEQNGSFELEMVYPLDGTLADKLEWQMLVRAKPNPDMNEQLFRIYDVKKTMSGESITVKARHITNDLAKCFVEHFEVEKESQQAVLSKLEDIGSFKHGFKFKSNKDTISSTTLDRVSVMAAFAGTNGSVLDNWGGEIIRDNYTLSMNSRRGRDNGLKILYRKNLTGLEMTTDASSVVVAIYPFATKEDKTIVLDGDRFIKSDNYDQIKAGQTIPVDFSSDESVVDAKTLRTASEGYFKTHKAEPSLNVKVEFEQFQQSDQYGKFKNLERVGMGDTVYCYYPPLKVDISGRVIKYVFDSINQEYTSLEIGSLKSDFLDNINNSVSDVADGVQNMGDDMNQAIDDVTNAITGNDGGYVVLYPPKHPEEIYIMDSPDQNTANHVLRLNKSGIGFSKYGINGPYETAWTIDGQFVADYITSGNLNAGLITAGVIQDKLKNLVIDLNSGTITFKKGAIRSINETLDIDIDKSRFSLKNSYNGSGFTMADGSIYFDNFRNGWYETIAHPQYGKIEYVDDFLNDHPGMALTASEGLLLLSGKDIIVGSIMGDYIYGGLGALIGPKSIFLGGEKADSIKLHNNRSITSFGTSDANGVEIAGKNVTIRSKNINLAHGENPNAALGDHGQGNFILDNDSRSGYLLSLKTYERTYGSGSTMTITSNGVFGRISSASKYKLAISETDLTEKAHQFLSVKPKQWFDKSETEQRADELSTGNDDYVDKAMTMPHTGFIAEDLKLAGLDDFVLENNDGELEGIQYDRLPVLYHQLLKEAFSRLDAAETKINKLERKLSNYEDK